VTPEIVIAISSVIVALLAFVVSIWERVEARQHNRKSVTPRLRIDLPYAVGEPVRVRLVNSGVGPAVIQKFMVRADGELIQPDSRGQFAPVIERVGLHGVSFRYAPCAGDAFAPGESQDLIRLNLDGDPEARWVSLRGQLRRVAIEIEYQSIYGERYSLKSSAMGTPLDAV
jgi:hypothetical protein